jgi:hypothetical protein
MGVEALADISMVMRGCTVLLEVHASFMVIFAKLWKEEVFKHVQIHGTGNGALHKKERAIRFIFAEGAKHINPRAVMNMFHGGMWIFGAPNHAVGCVDLTGDMKHAFITENYVSQVGGLVEWR